METEALHWEEIQSFGLDAGRNPSEIQIESLCSNFEQRNLVAPLREAHAALARTEHSKEGEEKRQAALALQEQWNTWFVQREQLRGEIKRGKELLEQVQGELAALRTHLEEWPAYERICGKNPLFDYLHSIWIKERIEQFLPAWVKRREDQLNAIHSKMELCAKQNGLEHLL
jgi:hypothetical protein